MALRWYVVHAYSNFEHKVQGVPEGAHQAQGLQEQVRRDPGADRGSRRDARRPAPQERAQVLPGYVLVQMEMDERTPGTS